MAALHNPRRPACFRSPDKGGRDVRQSAAESKIVQFPTARSAGRYAIAQEEIMDQTQRMPFGVCLIIWATIAMAGWAALDIAVRLI
jgi:hypothetical protein